MRSGGRSSATRTTSARWASRCRSSRSSSRSDPVDGYRIHEADYYLRDPGLEPDELAALNLALSAVRLDGVQGVEALWKLGGVVDDEPAGPAELASLPSDPTLVPVFSAIVDRRTATFVYRRQRANAERTVEPYRLDFRRGRWYVTGLDRLTEDEREFRLDRIEAPVRLSDPHAFERPDDLGEGPAEPWEFGDGDAGAGQRARRRAAGGVGRTPPRARGHRRNDGPTVPRSSRWR